MGYRAIRIALIVSAFGLSVSSQAQEASTKPGSEYRAVEGLQNWTYEYDMNGLKPGTYNILARAIDSAGNVSFSTPFNMILDPESDLPKVSIVNPLPMVRVGADLNIVGTCVDDDAVAYVEVRLDDGDWQRTKGSDYWSLYLPTSGVADGLHTIAARGIDSGGLAGKEAKVSFHLDRTKPLHELNSPEFGAIVSGKVRISGSVYDANGITDVSYSIDSGQTWSPLRRSYDKKSKTASFTLSIDSTKLPDGPTVLWIKSVDGVGSEGFAVFLYFVDNTKPELVLLSPATGETLNGVFDVRGRVYDTVGIRSMEWTYEKESGVVEMIPGNPYFNLQFRAPPKAGTIRVRLNVVDVAGNSTTMTISNPVDPKADLPIISMLYPTYGSKVDEILRVVGTARDDDGVASVTWRIDSGQESTIPSDGVFSFSSESITSGQRTLFMRATDINGLDGPWFQTPFTYMAAAPRIYIDMASDASGDREAKAGVSVSTLEGRASLKGQVKASNPLSELSYTINGGLPMKLSFSKTADGASFIVPLPPSVPSGVLDVSVQALDSFGKSGSIRLPILAIDYSRPRVGPLLDFGLASVPGVDAPATVIIRQDSPLIATFVTPFDGESIRSVRLEPSTSLVSASFDGSIVSLSATGQGATAPTLVVVETARAHRFESGPMVFKTDNQPPDISILEPALGTWLGGPANQLGAANIVIEARDGDRIQSVEYSLDGGDWLSLTGDGDQYRGTLETSGESRPVRMDVRATDRSGNVTQSATAFMVDSTPPKPERILPRPGDEVSGPTLFVVQAGEKIPFIRSLEFGRPDAYTALNPGSVISFVADVGSEPLLLRVSDLAGNIGEIDLLSGLSVMTESASAPPSIQSIKTNAEALASGLEGSYADFSGSDAVGPLSWAVPIVDSPEGVDVSLFPDYAIKPIRASGPVSLNATFRGVSPDPKKPIASWGYQADEINQTLSLKKASEPDTWTATIKLAARPDGPATLWVSIQDVTRGRVYALVSLEYDTTPANIEVLSPLAASGKASSAGPFMLVVRATDASGIASLSYESGIDKGDFKLAPGSGDGAIMLEFPAKATSRAVILRALDGSGNKSSYNVTIAYDAGEDRPTIGYLLPKDRESLSAYTSSPVLLYASDDDGLSQANLVLDGKPLQAIGPGPVYALETGILAAGKHTLSARSIDSTGNQSAAATTTFLQAGTPPLVTVSSILKPSESGAMLESYAPGTALAFDGKTALVATLSSPEGLSKVELSYNGGVWSSTSIPKPDPDGRYTIRCVLPSSLPYDRNVLSLKVSDGIGAISETSTSFYRVVAAPMAGSVTGEGIYLYDDRLVEGMILMAPGETLEALWYGRPILSVSLEPALAYAEARFDGSRISIQASKEGGAGDYPDTASAVSTIRVETMDGDVFLSSPIHIVSDSGSPDILVSQPISGAHVGGSFTLSGTAIDTNDISILEWSMDNGSTWTRMDTVTTPVTPATPDPDTFLATLGSGIEDGALGILVRAIDRAGRNSVALTSACKDIVPPTIHFETPRSVDTVNGTILISGYVQDDVSVASIELSADGTIWEAVDTRPRGSAPMATRRVSFSRLLDLGTLPRAGASLAIRAMDDSGNAAIVTPLETEPLAFMLDNEADKPVIQVQIPYESEVIRSDFTVSGMAFDDDGIAELFWRLDGSEWNRLSGSSAFAVPFKLVDCSDNEHVFEAYAVDLNGVSGEVASRSFRISLEEPVGMLLSPNLDFTNKGTITLRGTASDANGIAEVSVSFDNGATYNNASGSTDWTYSFDTNTIPDGVHSIYVRLVDGYETPGFAAGLIAVDNTAPTISLDSPLDGEEGIASLTVSGRLGDGIAVHSASIQVSKVGSADPVRILELKTTSTFRTELPVSDLAPGWYNIKAIALDRAGNAGYDTRNILVMEPRQTDYAEFIFPAQGEVLSGRFTIDGRVVSSMPIARAAITVDGQPYDVVELGDGGWFSLAIEPGAIADGERTIRIEAVTSTGAAITSLSRLITYSRAGPWVDIDSLASGDFVIGRPYLTGMAGWESEAPEETDKSAMVAYKELLKQRRVSTVEISRDNGKTWQEASGTPDYKYRLETQEYPNGRLMLLIKASYSNGNTAVRKRLVVLDTKLPVVTIHKPAENGRYNQSIVIEGSASDANGLSEVSVVLRSGDKASYEVPGFIQGSYIDTHLLGATRYEAGLGLSFFEDNVRLQLAFGEGFDAQPSWDNILGYTSDSTPAAQVSRFGGYVLGARLLANLAYLPFSYWFGPDWDFFSMSFTLGASFTYFSMRDTLTDILNPPESRYLILSGIVGQWEFAKFNLGWKVLKSIGLYIEGGMVFIPSEASTTLEEFIRPNVAFGLRIGLF